MEKYRKQREKGNKGERGVGARKSGKGLVLDEKGLLLDRERQQTWHIGKWPFIKVNGEPHARTRCLILI